jgi:hypothetical protein
LVEIEFKCPHRPLLLDEPFRFEGGHRPQHLTAVLGCPEAPARGVRAEELPHLLPAPERIYDVPAWSEPKVHKDFHVEVLGALYSVPISSSASGSGREPTPLSSRSCTGEK